MKIKSLISSTCRPEMRVQEICTTHAQELNWSSWRSQFLCMRRGNFFNSCLRPTRKKRNSQIKSLFLLLFFAQKLFSSL